MRLIVTWKLGSRIGRRFKKLLLTHWSTTRSKWVDQDTKILADHTMYEIELTRQKSLDSMTVAYGEHLLAYLLNNSLLLLLLFIVEHRLSQVVGIGL